MTNLLTCSVANAEQKENWKHDSCLQSGNTESSVASSHHLSPHIDSLTTTQMFLIILLYYYVIMLFIMIREGFWKIANFTLQWNLFKSQFRQLLIFYKMNKIVYSSHT